MGLLLNILLSILFQVSYVLNTPLESLTSSRTFKLSFAFPLQNVQVSQISTITTDIIM